MRGTVYKRGASWTCVFDEQPDENGKRRQRSKGGFSTRKEAEQFLTKQLERLNTGTYATPSKLTVADFLEREWLPAVEGRCARSAPSSTAAWSGTTSNRASAHTASRASQAAR
jgi:hypothetical protein